MFPISREPLAQAVEHLPFKQRVAGSNPARLTTMSPSSSLAQDTGLSRRQHGFESRRGRQKINRVMRMKNPPHPGRVVRQECIEPLNLTITEAAKRLGVTRQALNNLVNEKAGISPEMAIRLSKAFGSSPEVWLGMQMEYDLAQIEKDAERIKVKRIA
jgi:addiction module HigA family antidote